MTPLERWEESMRLWSTFRLPGGRLQPERDPGIAFHDARHGVQSLMIGGYPRASF
ncbi:MAG TPA: hypothetical protein VK420_03935 [Longimicrobium sp.]|nr:hypothetical protein [Longimicrobium sp.]